MAQILKKSGVDWAFMTCRITPTRLSWVFCQSCQLIPGRSHGQNRGAIFCVHGIFWFFVSKSYQRSTEKKYNVLGVIIAYFSDNSILILSFYTRARVRSYIPAGYETLIDELINLCDEGGFLPDQYSTIIESIIRHGQAPAVIQAVCEVIKALNCDHLHIVGDIFDQGPRANIVMDSLSKQHNMDIQWGTHDILWMGAASGSWTLVVTVLSNSIRYITWMSSKPATVFLCVRCPSLPTMSTRTVIPIVSRSS